MKRLFLILLFFLFYQDVKACSCYRIPSFQHTIQNIDKERDILILGEIKKLDSFISFDYGQERVEEYAVISIKKRYTDNINADEIYFFSGPTSACVRAFNYEIGTQFIILGSKSDFKLDENQFFSASVCRQSKFLYDVEKDLIKGNITPFNSLLDWLYELFRIDRYPQNEMTLEQIEEIIQKHLIK